MVVGGYGGKRSASKLKVALNKKSVGADFGKRKEDSIKNATHLYIYLTCFFYL